MTDRRKAGRPRAGEEPDTRAALIEAAIASFAREGYEATSTRYVAELAGVAPANLRHRFGSKAGLFAAAHDHAMGRLATVLGAVSPTDATPGDAVRLLGALAAEAPDVVAFLAVAPLERWRHPELRTDAEAPLGVAAIGVDEVVRAAVGQWAEEGRIAEGIAVDTLADTLVAVCLGFAVFASTSASQLMSERSVDTLARLIDGRVWNASGPLP